MFSPSFFVRRGLTCPKDILEIHLVAEDDLELLTLPPPSHKVYDGTGVKFRTSDMLDKHSLDGAGSLLLFHFLRDFVCDIQKTGMQVRGLES